MDATLELALEVLGIFLLVATGTAYATFRGKVRSLIEEVADLLAQMYAFAVDIADGGPCDTSRAVKIKAQIELVWCDLQELAPFVAELLARKSDLAEVGKK